MEATEAAEAVKGAVDSVGGAFMTSRATRARGAALELPDWRIYVAGRAGVLGDVDADVVTAALVFFPPPWVREHWEAARAVLPPAEAAREYAEACRDWGRAKLGAAEGLDRLAALAERVVAAVDPPGLPLFSGWRALPLPEDPPARVAQLLMVLREHRGNAHALAVLAHGLTPLEALVAGPNGPSNATFFGWPPPYPDPGPVRERWRAAEAATGRLVAPAFTALDAAERAELVGLVTALERR